MRTLHIIGFGSQAKAWSQCLRASGWQVRIYLTRSESPSFAAARALGFEPTLLMDLRTELKAKSPEAQPELIAFLCPDSAIGDLYAALLSDVVAPLTLILAHGYAVYAGDLKTKNPAHEIALLAPKAIGPKIWQLFQERKPGESHRLVAGFHASIERESSIRELALSMGFSKANLARATFEQETIGDLLSEQGLLCGGVFTLLEWTLKAMQDAGVPAALIREECLTELELIAGLLRERGPSSTFKAISQAAQCGTIAMQERLEASNAREFFEAQLQDVLSKKFVQDFRSGEWKPKARALTERLARWEDRFTEAAAKNAVENTEESLK
jgi:ketol-acid reductoisomerase